MQKLKYHERLRESINSIYDKFMKQQESPDIKKESYQVQIKFINMKEIEGDNKLSISFALKNSSDLDLFEQDAIQKIIAYKWITYSKHFFQKKFVLYLLYMVTFYVDMEIRLYR